MYKYIFIYSLITVNLAYATTVESQLGISVGMTSTKNDGGSKFKNPTFGLSYQDNSYIIMPRVDLEYVKLKDEEPNSLFKGSVNGVYEFENSTAIRPYLVAGVGYESVSGAVQNLFESHPFVHGGGGLNIGFLEDYNLNLEGKFLQILGGKNEENELVLTAGITIPLSKKEPIVVVPEVVVPTPVVLEPLPPKPVVVEPIPIKITSPEPIYIDKNECSIKTDLPDLDRDGIEDSLDQCPGTPCDFTVDSYGCPIKVTLKINFASNSAEIQDYSMARVIEFADFLLKNKGSSVNIVGHTDSVGKASTNLLLSERRAQSVAQALIARGVSSFRIHAEGRGETQPIASNKTASGRALNRRIEAELTYPKGVR